MVLDDRVDFKFCSQCGRLTPLTEQYFIKKNRKHGSIDGFYSSCKKCRNGNRRAAYLKDRDHYMRYREKWDAQKRKEYLSSIGETEASLNAKKAAEKENRKKQKTLTERKAYLKRKAVINPKKIKGKKRPAVIDIFGNKKCRKCGQWKQNNADSYSWRGDLKTPAFDRICKNCRSRTGKRFNRKPILFDSNLFQSLSQYEETRSDPTNTELGQCRCAYCGRWVNPTYGAVKSRIASFNYTAFGENRIYCAGDQCREACPTYQQQMYPKGFKINSSREVDPAVRVMCLERDSWTCQRCGANDPDTILHAHHILSYKRNIILANDIENVITLCKVCHNEIHKTEGCSYYELRCDQAV